MNQKLERKHLKQVLKSKSAQTCKQTRFGLKIRGVVIKQAMPKHVNKHIDASSRGGISKVNIGPKYNSNSWPINNIPSFVSIQNLLMVIFYSLINMHAISLL